MEVGTEERLMGSVLRFPLERRKAQRPSSDIDADSGRLLILPVIQVERHDAPRAMPHPAAKRPNSHLPRSGGDKPRRGRRSA